MSIIDIFFLVGTAIIIAMALLQLREAFKNGKFDEWPD